MSTKEVRNNEAAGSTSVANLDMKLEVVVIPVSDADRAKRGTKLGGQPLTYDFSVITEKGVTTSSD